MSDTYIKYTIKIALLFATICCFALMSPVVASSSPTGGQDLCQYFTEVPDFGMCEYIEVENEETHKIVEGYIIKDVEFIMLLEGYIHQPIPEHLEALSVNFRMFGIPCESNECPPESSYDWLASDKTRVSDGTTLDLDMAGLPWRVLLTLPVDDLETLELPELPLPPDPSLFTGPGAPVGPPPGPSVNPPPGPPTPHGQLPPTPRALHKAIPFLVLKHTHRLGLVSAIIST